MRFSDKQKSVIEKAVNEFRCNDALSREVMDWLLRVEPKTIEDASDLVGYVLAVTYGRGDALIPPALNNSWDRLGFAKSEIAPRIVSLYKEYLNL